jgi:hypothetical protein
MMIHHYRGWTIDVVAVEAGDAWFATATVREPGARPFTPGKEVVPGITAKTQASAIEEIIRRTHEWIDDVAP